ncbi:MAG: glycoside hydrolase family 9 protein [Bacteroidia bacterium]|nr:glycoside hydrolase family 9 protein [Bacteroidia bacterium]
MNRLGLNINHKFFKSFIILITGAAVSVCCSRKDSSFNINSLNYFEKRGLNVFVFSNLYNGLFSDSKISGIEIIHHEVRTATNGDVRLSPTPEQWDPIPEFIDRKIDRKNNAIEAFLKYPAFNFQYSVKVVVQKDGLLLSVNIDKPLPAELEGKAGFNLEFLPSAYFEKTYFIDGISGTFPLYPGGPMEIDNSGVVQPKAIAKGKTLVLSPEDPERCIKISTVENELSLFDGRNKAQNGWYVVRSLIPSGKTGKVVEWYFEGKTIPGWIRKPVIAHSQLGYHPDQKKVAVIELDTNDTQLKTASVFRITGNAILKKEFKGKTKFWGKYLRYNYLEFDFSAVSDSGLYIIEYGENRTLPFRIAKDIYEKAWQPAMDIFFPVQMDHMFVNEAYRVWHGVSHLDDALQAPVNYEHFDLYAQGPTTDTPFKPGEHIPGLNIGGWYDAGDFDIRTQSQYAVVLSLVKSREAFGLDRDETLIDQKRRYVDIHLPDGKPDILQQIEHGTLALIAQHRAVGHAINGIIASDIKQYTHLGDGSTTTDNLIYNPYFKDRESNGKYSGLFDDRWAFNSKSSSLNYGSVAALAASSRVLWGYNDKLAEECIQTAVRVWEEEHIRKPDTFRFGNTTGGPLEEEELKAACELFVTTKEKKYEERIIELWPLIEKGFNRYASFLLQVLPLMDESYTKKSEELVRKYKDQLDVLYRQNPFGVPISRGGWAGSGSAIGFTVTNYLLHKAFPEIIDREYALKGLNYIYGCHPGSDISFVSGVGTRSKKVAYGNNRADFSFIAGGVVPGVLILEPDFPENKEDWPFLWGENEYVINVSASYIFAVNAVNELLNNKK